MSTFDESGPVFRVLTLCLIPSVWAIMSSGRYPAWMNYMHFVTPLCNQLYEEGKELLYMHFSGHPALLHTLQQAYQYPVDI